MLPSGLTSDGVAVLDGAVSAGVKIAAVNVMAMDYDHGATPMIGVNDTSDEVCTVANAKQLVAFAASRHLAWLSMWPGARDAECSGGAQSFASPLCGSIAAGAERVRRRARRLLKTDCSGERPC